MDQLSRDARAARALGISYGKYKGLQWEQEQAAIAAERKAREEARARKRAEKEAALAAAQAAAQTAKDGEKQAGEMTKAEQDKAWRRVYAKGKPKTTCCRWCGKEFPVKGNNAFCSTKCRHAQRLFNQRKYINKKRGKLPPKKEDFLEVQEHGE